jgi:hypothetical protein
MNDLLDQYLPHVDARVRSRQTAVLPAEIATLCSQDPRACLELILRALESATTPAAIEAIGNELLQNLLNEHSGRIGAEVSELLRENKRFRQAFSCGKHASVDPALIAEWVLIFESLHTTKQQERKALRKSRLNPS